MEKQKDNWDKLKQYTDARIALGRVGVSIPLAESLQFKLAHAHAKDAVYAELKIDELIKGIESLQLKHYVVQSQADNRSVYLQRPDLGRKLNQVSYDLLKNETIPDYDISIIISDGLAANAVNENALPLIEKLVVLFKKNYYNLSPVIIAKQARVAIGDSIGYLLRSKMVINLIGERPGLSATNSMGAYLTYNPVVGLTDERRNCISNIRPQGLNVELAADKIFYFVKESFRLKISGINIKDNEQKKLV
ncbi:MAG: ethanolamine ammonia-lyase subunit EutC [Arachidicoccus sp.]|nr:ethanolamine ammonia-lyase subunit EutC [Arachidicoccus sp.]